MYQWILNLFLSLGIFDHLGCHIFIFFHFSLVHIFYLHFRTLIEIETWCVKTSGAETEFKFDAWKSRWQVSIGFQFCNTHTWFHQTFLSLRNLETFMYHSRKETETKKTQQRRNSLLVTIEVNNLWLVRLSL